MMRSNTSAGLRNFELGTRSGTFIAAEAAIFILHNQKGINAVKEGGIRDDFRETAVSVLEDIFWKGFWKARDPPGS